MTTGTDHSEKFEVTVTFAWDRVTVGIGGEVDVLTAPELAALLDTIIDRGHTSVLLDLAKLGFMDASGLRVIASGAARLGAVGGKLTIRSPSHQITRLLDITGLNQVVSIEEPERTPDHLGPEELARAPVVPAKFGVGDLTNHLRQVTAIPADHDVVDGALRLVVALARATVEGADGVSVSLQRHGRLATVAATDQTILDMDADQYATGEGPCVDASVEGRWFHVESLDQETRWPAFIPKARELGINAILSSPLVAAEHPVGALNIYSRTRAAFSEKEQELAAIFATEASIILRDAGADVSDDQLSEGMQAALEARQIIARAEGVIMDRQGISAEDAYTVLRRFSQSTNLPLVQRAADIVESTNRSRPELASETEEGPWPTR
jgi:anti-anti-sigma factor